MRVLVVEDDLQTAIYVRNGIGGAGCCVDLAGDGHDGLEQARQGAFDVLIIDRMLPKLDGMTLVRTLRDEDVRTPVLFLTAMGAIADRVEGLEGGGDDYLVKPFSLAELKARVGALARRPAGPTRDVTTLRSGEVTLDRLGRAARIGEREIDLLPLQFKLLEFLMLNAGRVVTRAMLLQSVWGFSFDPRTNIVETHLSHLRAKIDTPGRPSLITTVRGAGYALRAD
ncbi:MAG TPA: response regulator transcription factor [Caulobacteraceae bacterium]|jgi:two-component system OmpR family response regulator|nr:response regulator transcription factor [Caulobacteraceae bacterium]